MLEARIDGNARFQAILKDPARIEKHIGAAKELVERMDHALLRAGYLSGARHSLADCFATAALARFRKHGFEDWWAGGRVAEYYARMRARPSFEVAELDEG